MVTAALWLLREQLHLTVLAWLRYHLGSISSSGTEGIHGRTFQRWSWDLKSHDEGNFEFALHPLTLQSLFTRVDKKGHCYVHQFYLSFKYLEKKLCCHGDINEYISSYMLEPPRFSCRKLACRHAQSSHTIWEKSYPPRNLTFNPFLFSIDINTATREPDTSIIIWAAGWGLAHVKDSSRSLSGWVVKMDRLVHLLKQDSNQYPHEPQLKRLWHRLSLHCTKPFGYLRAVVLIQVLKQGVIPSGRQTEIKWNWKWSCTAILWDLRKGIAMSSWGGTTGKGQEWAPVNSTHI